MPILHVPQSDRLSGISVLAQNLGLAEGTRPSIHKAELTVGARSLDLWLTALPMATALEEVVAPVIDHVRTALQTM